MPKVGFPIDIIYQRLLPRLFKRACRLTRGNAALAEDLTQQAFTTFMTIQCRYSPDAPAAPILSNILRNHYLKDLNKASNRRETPQDPSLLSGDLNPLDEDAPMRSHFSPENIPKSLLDGNALPDISLRASIDELGNADHFQLFSHVLSPLDRQIFHFLTSGYRQSEIAEVLDLSPSTISQHASNLRTKVQEFQEIITQCKSISTARDLRVRLNWRSRIRHAAESALNLPLERPILIKDILKEAKLERANFGAVRKIDPGLETIVKKAVETSAKERIKSGYQAATNESATPFAGQVAKHAGMSRDKLLRIIEESPHLLPEKMKIRFIRTSEDHQAYIVERLKQHQEAIDQELVPVPLTYEELAEQLDISLGTLRNWRRFDEGCTLVDQILDGGHQKARRRLAEKQQKNAADRRAELLPIVIESAKKYQAKFPNKQFVSREALEEDTGISEYILDKTITEYKELLKSLGLEFIWADRDLETEVLDKIAKIKKQIEAGKIPPLENKKHDLYPRLGANCEVTALYWIEQFPSVKAAIEELFTIGQPNTPGRLHRGDQTPVEQRPMLFTQGYEKAAADRDLGKNPVTIEEIARIISYGRHAVSLWAKEDPNMISENMILDLRRGWPEDLIHEHRLRRIKWALEHCRTNGDVCSSPRHFFINHVGLSKSSYSNWQQQMKDELISVFEEYTDVIQRI